MTLVLLDLSSALYTVDHQVLLRRPRTMLGVQETALVWFQSYLEGRTLSRKYQLTCGVLQWSCLGPLLFTIDFSKLFEILKYHLPTAHAYAEDTQLYLSFSPEISSNQTDAIFSVENCIQDIRRWMIEGKLMLNDDKTELMVIGTQHQLSKVSIQSVKVGEVDVPRVTSARNLGTWFDSNLNMSLYNIRRIRKYLSKDNSVSLVHALITSRIDYCNILFHGLPNY